MEDLIIVDCQNDFIDGTLACAHGQEAVENLIAFMNTHDVRVRYSSDWHKPTNQSFRENGGIWPVHCVQESHGAALSADFAHALKKEENKPGKANIYYKGTDDAVEEYSAFFGRNTDGRCLGENTSSHIYVGGIALEYCVKETVLAFLEKGIRVTLLRDCLGWVDEKACDGVYEELRGKGVTVEDSDRV